MSKKEIKEGIIKKWENGQELMSKSSWTYWIPTGKHICSFIIGNSMGEKKRGKCIRCGKKMANLKSG